MVIGLLSIPLKPLSINNVFFNQGFIYGIDSRVVELTDDDYKKEMATFDTAFVEFIAPWCPHCKRVAPDFERAAKVIHTNDIPVTFVKVRSFSTDVISSL